MIKVTKEYFLPNLIAKLRFDTPMKCAEFENALRSLLEKDWRMEWENAIKNIDAENEDAGSIINSFEISKCIYFNKQISPMIHHILHLAENAVEVDDNNVYSPVIAFLESKYKESK